MVLFGRDPLADGGVVAGVDLTGGGGMFVGKSLEYALESVGAQENGVESSIIEFFEGGRAARCYYHSNSIIEPMEK